ncbi:MAG TPA: hypothetical protein VKV34_04305 [Thermoleophilia bacterium]|nr:hypothetical protein [Thermoleophilia bacterium]
MLAALCSAAACTHGSSSGSGAATADDWSGHLVAAPAAPSAQDSPAAPASTAVLTQRGDNNRVGWNTHETVLNDSDVNPAGFGRRIAYPVDGKIYAQPLFVPGLHVDGGVHNTVIVATENDSLYAFDADATTASAAGAGPGTASVPAPLWHTSFLVNGATAVPSASLKCTSITPTFGIVGTPVIDPGTDTLYVVAALKIGSTLADYIHAVDIRTGRDTMRPALISASVPGTGSGSSGGVLAFSAHDEQQHAGLLLDNGVVYVAFASYCDHDPNHGWILGYQASDLRRTTVYNSTPNSFDGGIWQSATALAADAQGDIYFITGNGGFDLNTGGKDASDAVLRVRPENGTLRVIDYFSPFYQSCLNNHDQDFGSGAPLLLENEIIAVGKEGAFDVLDRDHLGGYRTIPNPCKNMDDTSIDDVIQETPPQTVAGGVWSAETAWTSSKAEYVYTAGESDHLSAWRLANGKLATAPASQAPETLVYPGGIPVGSSDGADPASGIVWVLDRENGPALRAYAADDLTKELYSTTQDPARDAVPAYDNFILPTVADGRVFLGAGAELIVYGLLK